MRNQIRLAMQRRLSRCQNPSPQVSSSQLDQTEEQSSESASP